MVALAAEQEFRAQQAAAPRQRRWRGLWGGAAALVAGLVGFYAVAKVWTDPNQELLRDLPVIEHLEVYRQAGDFDFVRRLNDEGLFTDDAADVAASRAPSADVAASKATTAGGARVAPHAARATVVAGAARADADRQRRIGGDDRRAKSGFAAQVRPVRGPAGGRAAAAAAARGASGSRSASRPIAARHAAFSRLAQDFVAERARRSVEFRRGRSDHRHPQAAERARGADRGPRGRTPFESARHRGAETYLARGIRSRA